MDTELVTHRILEQRRLRYHSAVPGLGTLGSAPCRLDGARLLIAFASAAPGHAPQMTAVVLDYCHARGYRPQWHVIPTRTGETELAPALTGLGMHEVECQRLMAHTGRIQVERDPRIEIAPINAWQEMLAYEAGSRAAFFDDPHPQSGLVERRARERLYEQERGWCRYFSVSAQGRPVGGCYYTLYEEIPTIMGVYTRAEARGRGVATALLAAVVDMLVGAGRPICCLYVKLGNPAEHLYWKLGFVPLLDDCTFEEDGRGV